MAEERREEALLRVVEKLERVDPEELERLVDELLEAREAIAQLARLARKLQETGLLAALEAMVDASEEEFSAIARPEMMGMISNMMLAAWMLGSIRGDIMFDLANTAPACVEDAYEELAKPQRKLGIIEMLNIMRSPEFAAALKAMQKMLSCLTSGLSAARQGRR